MISEFVILKDAFKYASLCLESLSPGYFVKIGKRLEGSRVVYWVMVPLEQEAENVDKEVS